MFTFVTFANGFSECTKSFDELLKDGSSSSVATTAKTEKVDFDECCTASGGTNVELLESCRTELISSTFIGIEYDAQSSMCTLNFQDETNRVLSTGAVIAGPITSIRIASEFTEECCREGAEAVGSSMPMP